MFIDNDFPFSRFGVGFDTLANTRRNLLESIRQSTQVAFPPYNIRKDGDNKYVIEIAAAGYTLGDFDIILEEDALRIKCSPPKEDPTNFLHQGLTYKSWTRDFVLNDGVKIKNATLLNGMLKIFLEHNVPQEKKPIKINIEAPTSKLHPQLLNESSHI